MKQVADTYQATVSSRKNKFGSNFFILKDLMLIQLFYDGCLRLKDYMIGF